MSSGTWTRRDHRLAPARITLRPRRLLSLRSAAIAALLALLGWAGWLWYSNSPFVAIKTVTVTGLSGPDVPQIREALTRSALTMTTLNVDVGRLDAAVERYPDVRALAVSTSGRHGLRIAVQEQVPVALLYRSGGAVVVDDEGRLLPQTTVPHDVLPTLAGSNAVSGSFLTGSGERSALAVLGAAPAAMLSHVARATYSPAHGVVLGLRNGPNVYFGPASQLSAKWGALIGVLQNPDSQGASYIDVSDPARPAAGVIAPVTTHAPSTMTSTTASTTGTGIGTGTTTGTGTGTGTGTSIG